LLEWFLLRQNTIGDDRQSVIELANQCIELSRRELDWDELPVKPAKEWHMTCPVDDTAG
jgi:hypothetical protein